MISSASKSSILQGFAKSRSMLAGNDAYIPNSYESIATVTVGAGGSSSISFTSIPSTYKHLQIRQTSLYNSWLGMRFNGITTASSYNSHYLQGNGSSATAGTSGVDDSIRYHLGSASSSYPSPCITDILDYTDTNKKKVIRYLGGGDANGSGSVQLGSGAYYGSNISIDSITIFNYFGGSIPQYSHFALYGIKA